MGKSYANEIRRLDSTYRWTLNAPTGRLIEFVNESRGLPLVSVGSGGSLTLALFAALLQDQAGSLSRHMTPLELASSNCNLRNVSALLVSARGRNPDAIASFRILVRAEPRELTVLCASKDTPLGNLANDYNYARLVEFDLPSGRDGFLATNSTIALAVLLARSYLASSPSSSQLPRSLNELVFPRESPQNALAELSNEMDPILERDTIIVLYDKWGKPAAFDLESKFTEAALGNVQLADFRNFAHGRHYWLAKNGSRSAVIALTTPHDKGIAERTIGLVPKEIPTATLTVKEDGPASTIGLLIKVMYLVKIAGELRGQDPGRPRVPTFGRRLYNLWTHPSESVRSRISLAEMTAISRKIGISANEVQLRHNIDRWTKLLRAFVQRLEDTRYGSIVFDYDGTLCQQSERHKGASRQIGKRLMDLLRQGVKIGVVTGRGSSVREDLRRIISQKYWPKLLVGYYNGSDISFLNDDSHPDRSRTPDETLRTVYSALSNYSNLGRIGTVDLRPRQITVEPTTMSTVQEVGQILRSLIKSDFKGVQIVESGHSVDILAPNVSKLAVVDAISTIATDAGKPLATLCIGDSGKWPGNDFALLSGPYSLSVNSVSMDPDSCWNLALAGHRNVQGTLDYVNSIDVENGMLLFDSSKLARGTHER